MPVFAPTVKLNNGISMPVVGLGTWKSGVGQVQQAVADAIDAGYRHIDCAYAYGNEKEVGAAIREKIEAGVVKREDLFVVSKAWNTFHSAPCVDFAIKASLENLGLDYLDLYLVHWPMGYLENAALFPKDDEGKFIYSDVDYLDTWRAFESCVKSGLTKSIGVSNFNSEQLQRILDHCVIKPVCNQIECHPYLNQSRLVKFCQDRDVLVTAYSPLGSPDRPWAKPGDPVLMDDPKLKELAAKYQRTVPQVLLRYQIQRGVVVIPKSVTKDRIVSNMDCHGFSLSEADVKYIDSFDCNGRVCGLEWVATHPYYPFHIEY
jgi:aldehyde reductase